MAEFENSLPSQGANEWFILFTEGVELPEFLIFSVEKNQSFIYFKYLFEQKLDISLIDFDVM